MRYSTTGLLIISLAAGAIAVGCGPERVAEQPTPSPAETAQPEMDVAAELAKLPEADRALAMEQRICPVSGELLGSMGPPIKLTVEGREVFICCPACEEPLRENPDEHLAKLDAS